MKEKFKRLIPIIACVVTICVLTCLFPFLFSANTTARPDPSAPADGGMTNGGAAALDTQFRELLEAINRYSYYPNVEYSPELAAALLASTGDPYCQYFTKEQLDDYTTDLSGNFVGIGVMIESTKTNGGEPALRLLSVFTDSPAQDAGLLPGDLIVAVDGKASSEFESLSAMTAAVRGEAGTQVVLTVLREGVDDPMAVTVTRGACVKDTVYSERLICGDTALGYVRVTDFDEITTEQFIRAVSALETAGVSAFIFDLRYNGGGYLDTVTEMLAYLVPDGNLCSVDHASSLLADYTLYAEGDTIYQTGRDGYYRKSEDFTHQISVPSAVLVNGATASAAELFTAGLRDYAAEGKIPPVTIVGENTYGKGCMQSVFPLPNGDYIKVTIALYTPPCGVNYHEVGVAPTVPVTASDKTSADLYLKETPGSSTLPDGATDTVLAEAIARLTATE